MKRSQAPHKKKGLVQDNVDACFFRQEKEQDLHPSILRQARQSGQLNLSGRGMAAVPDIVWNINMLSGEEVKSLSLSINPNEDCQWWDHVELTKLILASNVLTIIPSEIQNLQALIILDLHDNALKHLPDSLSKLQNIKKLDISRNQFETLPSCIYLLKNIRTLFVQKNALKELDDDMGNLSLLEELDLSSNKLRHIPNCIGFLSRVTAFNASDNHLVDIPFEIGSMVALKRLELSSNKVVALPESVGKLRHLEQLYVQHNKLQSIPSLSECVALKEVHCGFNAITEITSEFLEQFVGVKYLDFRDNKISEIPDTISWLQNLEALHLSNNNLSTLPYSMGTLPHLKILTIDGNPMRSIRRDIILRGTVHLMKWLQSRMAESATPIPNSSRPKSAVDGIRGLGSSPEVDKFTLKSTKSLNYSNKNLCEIPDEMIDLAIEAEVTATDLSKNNLTALSEKMKLLVPKLLELNLGFNRLDLLPNFLSEAHCLQYLDVRNNRISELPNNLSSLQQLREINLAFNKLQKIPPVLFQLKKLEILIASDNQIDEIDIDGLSLLPVISVLDLHNNNIPKVPAELGNLTQLKSLLLDGNLFRNPRAAILSRGTPALLDYLRNQITS